MGLVKKFLQLSQLFPGEIFPVPRRFAAVWTFTGRFLCKNKERGLPFCFSYSRHDRHVFREGVKCRVWLANGEHMFIVFLSVRYNHSCTLYWCSLNRINPSARHMYALRTYFIFPVTGTINIISNANSFCYTATKQHSGILKLYQTFRIIKPKTE